MSFQPMKMLLLAPLALLGLAACSSGGSEAASVTTISESPGATTDEECLALLKVTDDALANPRVSMCRLEDHDPLWNAVGGYATSLDYEVWRETGYVPTCDNLIGQSGSLQGPYDADDVAICEEWHDEEGQS